MIKVKLHLHAIVMETMRRRCEIKQSWYTIYICWRQFEL